MKSDSLKIGTQNAPHRALYHALGLTEEEAEDCILKGFLA